MNMILVISVALNAALLAACYWLYDNYVPKKKSFRKKTLHNKWWVVLNKGRYVGFYDPQGQQAEGTQIDSAKLSINSRALNAVTLTLYVNVADSVAEMQERIAAEESTKENNA